MKKYSLLKSKDYNTQLKKFLAGGVHYNFSVPWEEVPIHFAKGTNSRLWDIDGNEYLDCYAKFGSMILGHGNPKYNEALKKWIDTLLAVNHCDIDAEVSEMVTKCLPGAEMVRFGLSGTETLQNAIRLARAYTSKNRILRFEGHYHGNADNVLGGKFKDRKFPVPQTFKNDYRGTIGRAKNILEDQCFLIPWNDEEMLEETIEQYADEIAAIVTEPICINGGGIMPAPGYLEKIRTLCDDNNIVLIFDEIITGFRVGLSGAQGLFGVVPDLTTLGKAIAGGGVPVSALVGKREFMKLYESRKVVHAGTFNGYPLGLAAIKATIEILSENDGAVYKNMAHYTNQICEALLEEASNQGIPMIMQGAPNAPCYHCVDKELTKQSSLNYEILIKDIIVNTALSSYGILVSTVSRIFPNITLCQDDVAFFKDRIAPALRDAKATIDDTF